MLEAVKTCLPFYRLKRYQTVKRYRQSRLHSFQCRLTTFQSDRHCNGSFVSRLEHLREEPGESDFCTGVRAFPRRSVST